MSTSREGIKIIVRNFDKKSTLDKAYKLVDQYLAQDASGHDSAHIHRVVKLAFHLAKSVNQEIDPFLLEISALLHDIEDPKLNNSGTNIVANFLNDNHVPLHYQNSINDIISNLSYTATLKGKKQSVLEGKIVQDADRLDALGAIGIARTFAYGGHKGRLMASEKDLTSTIHHFSDKLLKLEDLMNTNEGKRLARLRTQYIKKYLRQFKIEEEISD